MGVDLHGFAIITARMFNVAITTSFFHMRRRKIRAPHNVLTMYARQLLSSQGDEVTIAMPCWKFLRNNRLVGRYGNLCSGYLLPGIGERMHCLSCGDVSSFAILEWLRCVFERVVLCSYRFNYGFGNMPSR